MKKPRRIVPTAVLAGLAALAALPVSAGANVTTSPSTLSFPERAAGTTSDPQGVAVTVNCTTIIYVPVPTCAVPDVFQPNPVLSGKNPGDFEVENISCGGGIPNNGIAPGVCAFVVRFSPPASAAGPREAILDVGDATTGTQPAPVLLKGSATAQPVKKKCKKGKKGKKKCKKKGKK